MGWRNLINISYRRDFLTTPRNDQHSISLFYWYDNLYRIKWFKYNDELQRSYGYDTNGNIDMLSRKVIGYTDGNNQLTNVSLTR